MTNVPRSYWAFTTTFSLGREQYEVKVDHKGWGAVIRNNSGVLAFRSGKGTGHNDGEPRWVQVGPPRPALWRATLDALSRYQG